MESNDNQTLDLISQIMKDPAIGELISSLSSSTGEKKEEKEEEKPEGGGEFSLPPQLLERLPEVMGALGGLDLSSIFSKMGYGHRRSFPGQNSNIWAHPEMLFSLPAQMPVSQTARPH